MVHSGTAPRTTLYSYMCILELPVEQRALWYILGLPVEQHYIDVHLEQPVEQWALYWYILGLPIEQHYIDVCLGLPVEQWALYYIFIHSGTVPRTTLYWCVFWTTCRTMSCMLYLYILGLPIEQCCIDVHFGTACRTMSSILYIYTFWDCP